MKRDHLLFLALGVVVAGSPLVVDDDFEDLVSSLTARDETDDLSARASVPSKVYWANFTVGEKDFSIGMNEGTFCGSDILQNVSKGGYLYNTRGNITVADYIVRVNKNPSAESELLYQDLLWLDSQATFIDRIGHCPDSAAQQPPQKRDLEDVEGRALEKRAWREYSPPTWTRRRAYYEMLVWKAVAAQVISTGFNFAGEIANGNDLREAFRRGAFSGLGVAVYAVVAGLIEYYMLDEKWLGPIYILLFRLIIQPILTVFGTLGSATGTSCLDWDAISNWWPFESIMPIIDTTQAPSPAPEDMVKRQANGTDAPLTYLNWIEEGYGDGRTTGIVNNTGWYGSLNASTATCPAQVQNLQDILPPPAQ